jgi:LPXTG-motif cell wall-anchored protein
VPNRPNKLNKLVNSFMKGCLNGWIWMCTGGAHVQSRGGDDVNTKRVGKVRRLLFGTGLMVSTLGAGVVATVVTVPKAAFADTTGYVGGTPPPQTSSDGSNAVEPVTSAKDGPGDLPFTGADIEELAAIGGGAILAGGLLVHRRRRRSRTLA